MDGKEQTQHKVYIFGLSYLKCTAVYKALPWEQLGYRVVIDSNPNFIVNKLRAVRPDLLVFATTMPWHGVRNYIDTFLKYGKQEQIFVLSSAYEKDAYAPYPDVQVIDETQMAPSDWIEVLSKAAALTDRPAVSVKDEQQPLTDEQHLRQCLAKANSSRVVMLRFEPEKQPDEALHPKVLARLEQFCAQNNGGAVFREQGSQYCAVLFVEPILLTEQLRQLSGSISHLRRSLCSLTNGRVCVFSSAAVNVDHALREYEKMKTLEPNRFFCARWSVISEAALMQDMDSKMHNWVELRERENELMEAALCGDSERIGEVLTTIFRDYVKRNRGIPFFQMVMAQLDAIWTCIYCITRQDSIQPSVRTSSYWCVEDALDEQIRRFREISICGRGQKQLNPLVTKTLMLLIRDQDRSLYVGSMAEQLNVSVSYLSRLFKRELGVGIVECSRCMSIYASAVELLQGDRKISELAQKYGFSDSKYYSKVFREVLKQSPTEWISAHRS